MVIERRSVEPLVRLGIFRVRTVRAANVVMFLVAAGLFAMFYFNTLYLQRVLGYSALEAGLAFLPFTAGIIIGAGLSQSLVPKLGAREVPLIGMPMAIVGLLLFMRLQPDGSYVTDLLPGILLASVGMGLTFVPITLIATSGIPHDDAGLASGLYNTSQQIGGALGLAILATLSVEATEDTLTRARSRAAARRPGTGARGRLPRRVPRKRTSHRRRLRRAALPAEAARTSWRSARARRRMGTAAG